MSDINEAQKSTFTYRLEDQTLFLSGYLTIKDIDQDKERLLNTVKAFDDDHLFIDFKTLVQRR